MPKHAAATNVGAIVAHHLHAIAATLLGEAPGAIEAVPAPAEAPLGPDETFLSLDGAIDLGNGSRMFARTALGGSGWAVLEGALGGVAEPTAFTLKGVLPDGLDPASFIAEAYRLLLDRDVDQRGLGDYLPVVAGAGGRGELLRRLASSGEASRLPRHLIIGPDAMLVGEA